MLSAGFCALLWSNQDAGFSQPNAPGLAGVAGAVAGGGASALALAGVALLVLAPGRLRLNQVNLVLGSLPSPAGAAPAAAASLLAVLPGQLNMPRPAQPVSDTPHARQAASLRPRNPSFPRSRMASMLTAVHSPSKSACVADDRAASSHSH